MDPKSIKADQAAAAEQAARKRAGIPELQLDALPSTIATKMMSFGLGDKAKFANGVVKKIPSRYGIASPANVS